MAPNNWHLVVCGINHNTSTLEQREPLQLAHEETAKANATFRGLSGVMESTVVATCNRIEFYLIVRQGHEPFQIVKSFYDVIKHIDISGLEPSFYLHRDRHAAGHLFRVAAGLDSMVLGENQILGQIKDAYSSACAVKAAGKVIHRLFHQAFRVGKQVRSDTEMGKGACSVSSAAVEMLKSRIEQLHSPTVLFVGVNQMMALAASGLSRLNGGRFLFANRTVQKAIEFAAEYSAAGYPLEKLPFLLEQSDVVITCTGSQLPIITHQMIDRLVTAHPAKKLTIMDMAVPRDVELEKDRHSNIELLDLEDVRRFVNDQQAKREQAIPDSEAIVDRKLDEFMYWFDHVRHEPMYNGLGLSLEEIRRQELKKVFEKLSPQLQKEVDRATRRLVDKLLHLKLPTTDRSQQSE
jgi:glutamyl-tRNA reductase